MIQLKLLGRAKPEVIGSPVKNAKAAAPAPRRKLFKTKANDQVSLIFLFYPFTSSFLRFDCRRLSDPAAIMQNPFAKPSAPAAAPLKESTNEKHSKAGQYWLQNAMKKCVVCLLQPG